MTTAELFDDEIWFDEEAEQPDDFQIDEYDITAAPNDFNVLTLYSFIESGAVKIPGFQRNYVWDLSRASKLIESLILGLPLSMSASYLLVLILVIPAALKLGIIPIAAHLFAIYFASVAGITPPTGGLFFMAAAMAGSSKPFLTGWTATRLAFAGFVVPFFFAYNPALLLVGSMFEIIGSIILSTVSIIFIAASAEGWLVTKLNPMERIILVVGPSFCVLVSCFTS